MFGLKNDYIAIFISACYNNNINLVKEMLLSKHRLDIDHAVKVASRSGLVELLSILISSSRFEPNLRIIDSIELAKKNGHKKTYYKLLENKKISKFLKIAGTSEYTKRKFWRKVKIKSILNEY